MLPKKPRNMHLVRRNLRSACASSSKSLLTAARRPRRKSKRCAIRHAGASPERATRPLDWRTERHDIVTRSGNGALEMNSIASWIWVLIPLAAIGIAPFKMWMRIKEKQIEAQTSLAAEKSAQYAQHMERVEARLRVLEQIVTDGGAQTAAQIEALRDQARIPAKDKVQ